MKIMGRKALNSLYANGKKRKLHGIGNQMFFEATVKSASSRDIETLVPNSKQLKLD